VPYKVLQGPERRRAGGEPPRLLPAGRIPRWCSQAEGGGRRPYWEKVTHGGHYRAAYFNVASGRPTKDAGLIAGSEVMRSVNDRRGPRCPRLDKKKTRQWRCTTSRGTFDVSVLEIGEAWWRSRPHGTRKPGRADRLRQRDGLDRGRVQAPERLDPRKGPMALQRLKRRPRRPSASSRPRSRPRSTCVHHRGRDRPPSTGTHPDAGQARSRGGGLVERTLTPAGAMRSGSKPGTSTRSSWSRQPGSEV